MRKPFRLIKLTLILLVLLTSSVKPLLVDVHNSQSNSVVTIRCGLSHATQEPSHTQYTTLSKAFKNNDREKNDIVCLFVPMKKAVFNIGSSSTQTVPIAVLQVFSFQSQVLRI